jgi:hypothetical protein
MKINKSRPLLALHASKSEQPDEYNKPVFCITARERCLLMANENLQTKAAYTDLRLRASHTLIFLHHRRLPPPTEEQQKEDVLFAG